MPLEDDNLVALDAGGFVDRLGIEAFLTEVDFCPSDKKCCRMMDVVEARKIEIAAIHDVDGPRLDDQLIEDIDIVNFPRCNDHYRRNVPMQIQKGMEFDRALAFSKPGPREKSKTQIDGCRIQDICRLFQCDAEGVRGVKFSGFRDEDLSKVRINPSIPVLIGVGKCIAGDVSSDAQMIKSGLSCTQTGLDISQTFAVGQLSEGHAEILVPAGKTDQLAIAVVSIYALAEFVCGDRVH